MMLLTAIAILIFAIGCFIGQWWRSVIDRELVERTEEMRLMVIDQRDAALGERDRLRGMMAQGVMDHDGRGAKVRR